MNPDPDRQNDRLLFWDRVVAAEPRLVGLAERARAGGDDRDWSNLKRDLTALVGDHADRTELSGADLYEFAYRELRAIFEDSNR